MEAAAKVPQDRGRPRDICSNPRVDRGRERVEEVIKVVDEDL